MTSHTSPSEALAARLADNAAQVGDCLASLLGSRPEAGELARPERLLEAMRYACLRGGKRLRPFLTLESARLFRPPGSAADVGLLRTAAAIEMVHCYSLVHDDLPGMDDDDLRRGQPSVHKAFDVATAILAGDALLTLAFDGLADPATHADARVRADLVLGLARAAGVGGMAGGQALDLAAESAERPLAQMAIERMQAMKTGALLRFAVDAGAIHSGAAASQRAQLSAYGKALGAAFQIADDILDAEGEDARLGKRAGKDAGRNKATLVAALGILGAKRLAAKLIDQAEAALAPFGEPADMLRAVARFTIARDH